MEATQTGARFFRSMLLAAGVYFALVFAAGFVLGSIRVPLLVPRVGERMAELAEMPFMLVVIYFAAWHVCRRFEASFGAGGWGLVGAGALVMLLAAELLLVAILQDRGIAQYIASRDPLSGSVYLSMLVLYAAMPWLQFRRRTRSRLRSSTSTE